MKLSFAKIYLILFVISADIFLLLPFLRPVTILNYIIFFKFITNKKKYLKNKDINSLATLIYIFIFFIFSVDLFQNDIEFAFSSFLSFLPIPSVILFLNSQKNKSKLLNIFISTWLIYNGFFALLQFFGFYFTAGELLALIPFIDIDKGFHKDFLNQGLRVSGSSYSIIGFSLAIGYCFFYYISFKENYITNKKKYLTLFIIIVLVFLSQTRSLIYSLFPLYFIFNFIKRKNFIKNSFILLFISFLIVLSSEFIIENFPRLFLNFENDASVVHRIQGNIYTSYATFVKSPLIGLPTNYAKEALLFGQNELGLVYGSYYFDEVTHHNMFTYYFRYYGLIGIILLTMIYRKLFLYSLKSYNNHARIFLFCCLLFQILYSMSHNTKLLTDSFLLILIALSLKSKKALTF